MADVSLTLVRRIRATPAKVFAALTTAELILEWWSPDAGPTLSADIDLRIGGQLRVVFRNEDGSRHEALGTFREIVPERRLAFAFAWGNEPEVETLVRIELEQVDGETEVRLTHSRFATTSARDAHQRGWNGSLSHLRTLLESEREE